MLLLIYFVEHEGTDNVFRLVFNVILSGTGSNEISISDLNLLANVVKQILEQKEWI